MPPICFLSSALGDQSNPQDLKHAMRMAAKGRPDFLFDFMVDDGGHTMIQQQV